MHHAAERSSLDMLALLLNIRTNEGETPLYLVCLQLLTRANYLLSDQARVSRRSDSGFEDHEQARLEIYVYLEVSSHFLKSRIVPISTSKKAVLDILHCMSYLSVICQTLAEFLVENRIEIDA